MKYYVEASCKAMTKDTTSQELEKHYKEFCPQCGNFSYCKVRRAIEEFIIVSQTDLAAGLKYFSSH